MPDRIPPMPESTLPHYAELNDAELRAKLNAETGRIGWPELQWSFARGVLIRVAAGLDLVEVAVEFARDDQARLKDWLETGSIAKAGDDEARDWQTRQPGFWAVVVAPWVLVQEITTSN